jgi:glutathione S-transferase
VDTKLYVIPGSHPAKAVAGMLEHKSIPYKRIDLLPIISRGVLRALRFPGVTVPSIRLDGRKITGSREISKALDEVKPEPPLFPADPERRAAVEEAERWGEQVLADATRRILWNSLQRDRPALATYVGDAKLGVPVGLAVATASPVILAEKRIHGITDEAVRADLAGVPTWLDQIDAWIADGTLGGDQPTAADFQIAGGVGLAMTLQDLRPVIAARPAGEHSKRFVPDYPGDVPPVLPREWLEPLQREADLSGQA